MTEVSGVRAETQVLMRTLDGLDRVAGRTAFIDYLDLPPPPPAGTPSVKDYGATGDGGTDDTAALAAAIADTYGRSLYFPAGTYLTGKITTTGHCNWIGDGADSTVIRLKPSSNDHLLQVGEARLRLQGLTLDGNRWNQSSGAGDCLYLPAAAGYSFGAFIEDCAIVNARGNGITAGVNRALGRVRFCEVTDHGGHAIKIAAVDWELFGNDFGRTGGDAVAILTDSVLIVGGDVFNGGAAGVAIDSAVRTFDMVGTTINTNNQDGVKIGQLTSGVARGILITSCIFFDNSKATQPSAGSPDATPQHSHIGGNVWPQTSIQGCMFFTYDQYSRANAAVREEGGASPPADFLLRNVVEPGSWKTAPVVSGPAPGAAVSMEAVANAAMLARLNAVDIADPSALKVLFGWKPSQLSGLMAWWDASQGLTINGSLVAAWAPRAGSATGPLVQATPAWQPTYGGGIFNGRAGVSFDGANDVMNRGAPFMYAAGGCAIFILASVPAGQANGRVLIAEINAAVNTQRYNPLRAAATSGKMSALIRNDANVSQVGGLEYSPTFATGTPHLICVIDSGTALTPYLDGVAGTPIAYARANPLTLDTFSLGSLSPGFGQPLQCVIHAVVIGPASISAGDRQKVEGYLLHEAGLAGLLDPAHPYKAAPPAS